METIDSIVKEYFEANQRLLQAKAIVDKATLDKRKAQKKIDDCKAVIQAYMLENGVTQDEGENYQLTLKKAQPTLKLNCKPEDLPEQYQRYKIEANKQALKDDIKAGLETNLASLEDSYSLTITETSNG
jgi:phage gp36-like protein